MLAKIEEAGCKIAKPYAFVRPVVMLPRQV